ncbi:MAG: hypothetical protein M2R45_00785 [Verrucomicrobia subdivision 3 bacterium]|nr:hypothetical protein [Limisphaerales bacterium]MCS1413110.1 hypothetical protein [Limisphaerales bacterium]
MLWFVATLPLAKTGTLEEVVSNQVLEGCRALVVDGSETNRMVLREYLSSWSMSVECASGIS